MTTTRTVGGKRLLLALLGVVCVTAAIILVPSYGCRPADPKLDHLGTVPAFQLVDSDGQAFTQDALRGHPTIIDFVFTRCDSICPIVSSNMMRVEDKTRDPRGLPIKFLSMTVDPAFDRPAVLAEYARRYKANPERWKFVTGEPATMKTLIEKTFMNSTRPEGTSKAGAPSIGHSGYFLLVDGNLEIRGAYDSADVRKLEQLMHDARFLARTTKRGYKFGGGS